jgi:hypothetical protein
MHQCNIKVTDLKSGDVFKLNPRHSKEYWVRKTITLESNGANKIRKEDEGKIIVMTWSCKQLTFDPDKELFLVKSAEDRNQTQKQ